MLTNHYGLTEPATKTLIGDPLGAPDGYAVTVLKALGELQQHRLLDVTQAAQALVLAMDAVRDGTRDINSVNKHMSLNKPEPELREIGLQVGRRLLTVLVSLVERCQTLGLPVNTALMVGVEAAMDDYREAPGFGYWGQGLIDLDTLYDVQRLRAWEDKERSQFHLDLAVSHG